MRRIARWAFLLLAPWACGSEPAPPPPVEDVEEILSARPLPGEMILIPAGEFTMGTDERPKNRPALEAPAHKVDLPAYYIDAYEVTLGQWIRFVTQSDYEPEGDWRRFHAIGKEDYPVANVTWEDAQAYAKWAGKRLPTEAEWEKAARGPEEYAYPWGNKWDPTKSNCNEIGYRNTLEVGQIETDMSPYGVYDMMGNVQEWTSEKIKPYKGSPVRGESAFRQGYVAVRGASYAIKGGSAYLWSRSGYFPKSQFGLGFRCVKDVESEEEAQGSAGETR